MLPKNLHYQNKIESAASRAYSSAIQPQNGTGPYTAGNSLIINIPTSPNTVLVPSECYLKFDVGGVTCAGATAYIRVDKAGLGHGVIQRLRLTHGSQEIESLDNYNALVGQLIAMQQSGDSTTGKLNILNGNCNALYASNGTREVTMTNVGERLVQGGNTQFNALVAGACTSRTVSINLLSMVGSLGGNHYIPLFEMTSAPLCLTIQLVSSALKFLNPSTALGNSSNFSISNVEFIGSFIELSDDSIRTIRQSLNGSPLTYVIQSYANITNTAQLANANTSVNHQLAVKYASLKSLFCIMRSQADGGATFFPLSSTHFNISDWRVAIGSQKLPYKAPNSMVEHYSELLKALGSYSNIDHETAINWYTYATDSIPIANTEVAANMDATTRSACFCLGFDLETYASCDKDKIFAGMNTLNSDVFWNINFSANASSPSVKFDYYALYDNVLIFENGVCRSWR